MRIVKIIALVLMMMALLTVQSFADGATTTSLYKDSFAGNASLSGSNGFTYTLNGVNPNLGIGIQWADYWRTTSENSSSSVGFTSTIQGTEDALRHRMRFRNDVARTIFQDTQIKLRDIIYKQDTNIQDLLYNVPYMEYTAGGARTITIKYTMTYETLIQSVSGHILESYEQTKSVERERSVSPGQTVQIPLLPNHGASYAIENIMRYGENGEAEASVGEYVFIKELEIRVTTFNIVESALPSAYSLVFPIDSEIEIDPNQYGLWLEDLVPNDTLNVSFVEWIVIAIKGILDFELLPGIKIWYILAIPLTALIVHAFIKIFAGG